MMDNATSVFNEVNSGTKGYNEVDGDKRKLNDGLGPTIASTHRCCAERRLLDSWVQRARRQGVPPHKVISWIRRKFGTHISVLRYRSDGSLGCAVPCLFCQKELERYDMRVHCVDASGQWMEARCSEPGALPKPVLTAGQRRMFNK
jgi:hypothetical protein